MKIKFDSHFNYYLTDFEPLNIISENYNCTRISRNDLTILTAKKWFENTYNCDGLCIVKYNNTFYLCWESYCQDKLNYFSYKLIDSKIISYNKSL